MNIKSKRTLFSILAGMIVGLLGSVFLRPTCWGLLIGVFVAAYLAKASTPKDGAIIGAIVVVPIGIHTLLQIFAQAIADTTIGILGNLVGLFLGLLIVSGIGALYGLIIGKGFELTKNKRIIF